MTKAPASKPADAPVRDPDEPLDEVVAGALHGLFGRDSLYVMLWGIQIVAAALVTPLMTRVLDAPSFGEVAAANAVMQVVFVVVGIGLYQAIQREYARDPGGRGAAKLLSVSVVAAVLLSSLGYLSGPLWAPHVGFSSFSEALRIAVLWAAASAVTNSALALLRSQDRLLAFSTVSLLQSVVASIASLVLVLRFSDTAETFLLGQLIVQVFAALLGLALARPRVPGRRDRDLVETALAFSLPLVPAVLCTFILNTSDRLILQSHLGSTAVAQYQVAYNVGSLPILLLGVLNSSWMPRFFSFKEAHERTAVISASRDLLYSLLVPVLIGLAAGAPLVLRFWAPPSYQPDTLLLVNAIVLVTAIPFAAAQASMRGLMADGRTMFIAAAQAVAAGLNVLLNLVLIPHFQLAGSAAATLLSFGALHVLMATRVRTLSRTLGRVRLPRASLMALLVLAAVVTLALSAVPAGSALVLRVVLVLLTLAWFGGRFVSATKALGGGPGRLSVDQAGRRGRQGAVDGDPALPDRDG